MVLSTKGKFSEGFIMVNEVKKGEIVIDNTENKFDEKKLGKVLKTGVK